MQVFIKTFTNGNSIKISMESVGSKVRVTTPIGVSNLTEYAAERYRNARLAEGFVLEKPKAKRKPRAKKSTPAQQLDLA